MYKRQTKHRELLVTPACAEVYKEEIGDVFECGNGAWTTDLERLLCPCQVALRAWMLGEDPIQALDAFRELPAANLLEYIHTMPERIERYEFVRPKGRKVKK